MQVSSNLPLVFVQMFCKNFTAISVENPPHVTGRSVRRLLLGSVCCYGSTTFLRFRGPCGFCCRHFFFGQQPCAMRCSVIGLCLVYPQLRIPAVASQHNSHRAIALQRTQSLDRLQLEVFQKFSSICWL